MLIVWIEGEKICGTFDMEFVPEEKRDSCVIFEDLSLTDIDKLTIQDGSIVLKNAELLLEEAKEKLKAQFNSIAYSIFSKTDWIIIKLQEFAIHNPVELQALLSEYQGRLKERYTLRLKLRELEKRIENMTSLEEQYSIMSEIENLKSEYLSIEKED